MSQFRTKEFERLKKIWDKRLEASGFKDAEVDGELKVLSINFWGHPTSMHRQHLECYEARQDYYLMCSSFLNFYQFQSKLDCLVWELHTNGMSSRLISERLKKNKIKANKDTVGKIVDRLDSIMKTGKFFGD